MKSAPMLIEVRDPRAGSEDWGRQAGHTVAKAH